MKPYLKVSFLVLITFLAGCKNEPLEPANIEGQRISINDEIKPDSAIINYIKPYKEHLNTTLDSVVAYNPTTLSKTDGELNTGIGNLMADIVMAQANPVFKSRQDRNIDFVLLNHGGIRAELPKGDVTARSAYQLMPFENEIVVIEITGKKVKEMLHYLEVAKTAHPVSGIQLKADRDYKIYDAKINGEPIEDSKTYFVATSDYLQHGGDNMKFFANPVNVYPVDYKIRNAIIDFFNKTDTIKAKKDNRYIRNN